MRDDNLTERQRKWFASVVQGLERDTGKSLADWVAIAKTCPETGHRARLKWFKEIHGLLQNRASQVLDAAFPSSMGWDDPGELVDSLWSDPGSRAIFEAVDREAINLGDVTRTARRGYTAWSRKVQFAALRPMKGGTALLGVAAPVDLAVGLAARKSQSWSERLTAQIMLATPDDVRGVAWSALAVAWNGA